MARPPTGQVVERQRANGNTVFALRFRCDGERVYETVGSSTDDPPWTRERAEEALKDRLAEVRLGRFVSRRMPASEPRDTAEPTFHEFASEWFAGIEPELRPSTAEVYRWHLTHHLLPFFRDQTLSQITVAEVDRYRNY